MGFCTFIGPFVSFSCLFVHTFIYSSILALGSDPNQVFESPTPIELRQRLERERKAALEKRQKAAEAAAEAKRLKKQQQQEERDAARAARKRKKDLEKAEQKKAKQQEAKRQKEAEKEAEKEGEPAAKRTRQRAKGIFVPLIAHSSYFVLGVLCIVSSFYRQCWVKNTHPNFQRLFNDGSQRYIPPVFYVYSSCCQSFRPVLIHFPPFTGKPAPKKPTPTSSTSSTKAAKGIIFTFLHFNVYSSCCQFIRPVLIHFPPFTGKPAPKKPTQTSSASSTKATKGI